MLSAVTFLLGSYLMLIEQQNKKLQHELKSAHEQAGTLEMRKQELLIELNAMASKENLVKAAEGSLGMVGYEPSFATYIENGEDE
jgi:hypothetical protein